MLVSEEVNTLFDYSLQQYHWKHLYSTGKTTIIRYSVPFIVHSRWSLMSSPLKTNAPIPVSKLSENSVVVQALFDIDSNWFRVFWVSYSSAARFVSHSDLIPTCVSSLDIVVVVEDPVDQITTPIRAWSVCISLNAWKVLSVEFPIFECSHKYVAPSRKGWFHALLTVVDFDMSIINNWFMII